MALCVYCDGCDVHYYCNSLWLSGIITIFSVKLQTWIVIQVYTITCEVVVEITMEKLIRISGGTELEKKINVTSTAQHTWYTLTHDPLKKITGIISEQYIHTYIFVMCSSIAIGRFYWDLYRPNMGWYFYLNNVTCMLNIISKYFNGYTLYWKRRIYIDSFSCLYNPIHFEVNSHSSESCQWISI